MAWVSLLGSELIDAKGPVNTAEVLEGKYVGLYFSAHWCPPCRGFTPELAEAYTSDLAAKGLEVVFVSSDNNEESFKEYFDTMPWKALPFVDRERKARLSKQFKVNGIPTLVILDKEGNAITDSGREAVGRDPKGENFPWLPKPLREMLGTKFIGSGGKELDATAVEKKVLGLYFSAHWCPPCRGFTPQLAEWYKKVAPSLPDFEIVFLSGDQSEEEYEEYFAEMPWISLPYSTAKYEEISARLGVRGIPSFVIVDQDGSVITTNGRSIPSTDPEGSKFPWYPEPLKDLANDIDGLNDTPSVVVFLDSADEKTISSIKTVCSPIAAEIQAKAKATGDNELLFFVGGPDAIGVLNKIRKLIGQPPLLIKHPHPLVEAPNREEWYCDGCGNQEGTPLFCQECNFDYCASCNATAGTGAPAQPMGAILDLSSEEFVIVEGVDFTDASSVRSFIDKFHAKTLTLTPITSS